MNVEEIKGIGPKTAGLFRKLGIETTSDLIRYYPVSYDHYGEVLDIGAAKVGDKCSVRGVIAGNVSVRRYGKVNIVTTEISDPTGKIRLTWYNAFFVKGLLKRGMVFIFRGTLRRKGREIVMDHPEIIRPDKYEELRDTLRPVYSLTKGLTSKTLAKAVKAALEMEGGTVEDHLPSAMRRELELEDLTSAVRDIHFPTDTDDLRAARRRLVFDEFFLFSLGIRLLKARNEDQRTVFPLKKVWETDEVIASLPYKLTDAQRLAWKEIEDDLTGKKVMSRLLQGDVGSGKTVIAFLALICAASNGCQAVMMAPTEVLARQHFQKMQDLLDGSGIKEIKAVLLTGSTKVAERREILADIREGRAGIVIGTHALFQESVEYSDLALVVTDEQHRFGVRQRGAFGSEGREPHVLVMSATPIPRTLGVIYYGDLDISVLDESPARRLPIKTAVVNESYMMKAYDFIEKRIAEGRQAYVICPMIEPSEGLDAPNVTEVHERFVRRFPSLTVDRLTGRDKPDEKNRIMEDLVSGKTDILVSTTVIEVGVDVPNAAVMLVMGAERFGLSQLHQLRGRVGRGEYQSYCIFMSQTESESASERLGVLAESSDGFYIAERDFELRGPGDLLGIRQSGDALFRIADVRSDRELLMLAGEAASAVVRDDPALLDPENEPVKRALAEYLGENDGNFVI